MDELKDYTSQTIKLKPDYEGEVTATLVQSKFNTGNRKSVLYIHGYIDFFFHAHVGEKFIAHQFDFYALDLRKYGRSLMSYQRPNFCKDIQEYFEEITLALRQIHESSNGNIFLLGHSTGGLIASSYMNFGEEKGLIKGLVLNSPFLDFNLSAFEKTVVYGLSKMITKFFPYAKISGVLPRAYVESIHKDFHGEWDFNLDWKPVNGFPIYFAWVLAIRAGQQKLINSKITVPILVLHSDASARLFKFSEEAMSKDIVLGVEDMKRVGVKLGEEVTLLEIENAQHDIFLSSKNVRGEAFKQMFNWLNSEGSERSG